LSLLIYSSVAVFVIVGGQPTTDDDHGDNPEAGLASTNGGTNLQQDLSHLLNTVARLQAKVEKLEAPLVNVVAENGALKASVAVLEVQVAELTAENGTIEAKLAKLRSSQDEQLTNVTAKNDMLQASLANFVAENGALKRK